jgi:hypothetical protein
MGQRTVSIALFVSGGVFVLGLLAIGWMVGSSASQAADATMHNCPQPSKWAIAVWDGDDDTDADQAFATCGAGAVAIAYDLDPATQAWSRWVFDRPEVSTLSVVYHNQGFIALGGAATPASPTPAPSPSPTPSPTPAPSPSPTPSPTPAGPATTFGDGTYVVGTDIAPGTYRNSSSFGGCYWERLSGFGGSFDEIIANGLATYRQVVTIKETDVGFSSNDCGTWSQDLAPITGSPTAPFGDGMYIVGVDIASGTWRNEGSSGCYWARLSGFSGEFGEIIANGLSDDPQIVTIGGSDAGFESNDCGMWSKTQ